MKKIAILFVILSIFMIQLVTVHAEDEQIDLSEQTYENLQTNFYSCGDELIEKIPANVPKIINIVYLFIQVLIPIILIIMGMITLLKAVSSSKEEDVKKAITFAPPETFSIRK